MKMFGVVSLAVLAVISSVASYPLELDENQEVYFVPQYYHLDHLRERRSPQLKATGGGSEHAGSVRLTGERNVFDNGKTAVDANGFVQRDYMRGFPSENRFGAGATVTHNLYKGRHGELEAFAGYRREWNTPTKHNAMGGLTWKF